ncbi:MAG TPA: adenylate/guanylate cyclase domain-containing protein [Burkholderiales bacterium]|nr:adenylate/guanylate cyclase domain-containing protein [Burkholderiales bacterium]
MRQDLADSLVRPLRVAAALLLLAAVAEIGWLHALEGFEGRASDFLVRSHAKGLAPDPDIVIVDIDEPSLARMQDAAGKFPWPRSVYADLVLGIESQKPRAIVFDILFGEEDTRDREFDRAFNRSLKGLTNVYLPTARLDASGDRNGVPAAQVAGALGLERSAAAQPDARIQILPPQIVDEEHWRRSGVINFLEDSDGVGRRYWIAMPAYGWLLPSLPARVARGLAFPVPDADSIVLNWRGSRGSFSRISFADLYDDFGRKNRRRPRDELKGKIVVVGVTAAALGDVRVTPISSSSPGVEILATAIDNLKNARAMKPAPGIARSGLAAILLALVLLAFRLRRNAVETGAGLAVATAALLGAQYAALGAGLLLPVAIPLLFAWALYLFGAMLAYLREKRTREQAVRLFSRFLNPAVVRQIVDQGETVESLSGKTRQMSILFSDIRGFTTLSETRPPQEIVALLNRYFSRQVAVVFRHGGTLDKFIGDCIMAFWGAPLEDPRHAEHAVAAALEMEQVLLAFKKELGEDGRDFDVGIGIHSGSAVVGFIGAEQKLDYTAIGDAVNLASRIEGLTKEAQCRILVSRETADACHNSFAFSSRGFYKVKGRAQEVELLEPRTRSA